MCVRGGFFFLFFTFVLSFSFLFSFVRSFFPPSFVHSFFPSFLRSFHLRSFVRFRFIPMYILIPLSHFITCSFIFFKKSSLWIIINHFSLISIHPSIPRPRVTLSRVTHPPILPLSPSNIPFSQSSSCYTPLFSKKKNV